MSNYEKHALREFKAAGWTDENGDFDCEIQKLICKQVLELLKVFSKHGHSGSTASYALNMFGKLAAFEPIVPLTGEDWEQEYWPIRTILYDHVFEAARHL